MTHMDSFKAVKVGLALVIVSALIFMLIGLMIGIFCVVHFEIHGVNTLGFMLLSLIICWPFWSFIFVKWQNYDEALTTKNNAISSDKPRLFEQAVIKRLRNN